MSLKKAVKAGSKIAKRQALAKAWELFATNVQTEKNIHIAFDSSGERVYRCRGVMFRDFKDAVLESAEFGNAEQEYLVIKMRNLGQFWVYDPKGGRDKIFDDLADAAEHALKRKAARGAVSSDIVAQRKAAYQEKHRQRVEKIKRAQIEREKERILAEKRREKEYEKIADIEGTW